MDGLDAGVIDTPDVETPELETDEAELGNAEGGLESAAAETPDAAAEGKDDPYTTRFGRDYRTYLNGLKQTDANAAKFVKQARDDYGRAFALQQLEPRGIDGIREKYALLDTLTHGEAKGSEAITAMQQSLQEWDDFDQAILSGDPKAFEGITPEFDAGLAKLAPAYLERVAKSDPAAYEAAILPHVVGTLMQSPVIQHFNNLVDVLNTTDDPRLDAQTKFNYAMKTLAKMSEAFNQLGQKAGEVKAAPADKAKTEFETQRTAFEQEKQKLHWDSKIEPKVQAHEKATFDKLLEPYQKRLKLGDKSKAGAFQAFHNSIVAQARADNDYQKQNKLYKSQKNPDPAAVTNFINVALSKYAKTAMDELVADRWEPFLRGKPATQAAKAGTNPAGPVEPNVEVRTVKPAMHEIDHQRTPIPWLAQKKYYLTNGKIVQVRQA